MPRLRSGDTSRKRDAGRDWSARNRGGRWDITTGTRRPATIPEPDPDWHPLARAMWDGLGDSEAAEFYQSSDWAMAYSMCEELSVYKRADHRNSVILAQINKAFGDLLTTAGERAKLLH